MKVFLSRILGVAAGIVAISLAGSRWAGGTVAWYGEPAGKVTDVRRVTAYLNRTPVKIITATYYGRPVDALRLIMGPGARIGGSADVAVGTDVDLYRLLAGELFSLGIGMAFRGYGERTELFLVRAENLDGNAFAKMLQTQTAPPEMPNCGSKGFLLEANDARVFVEVNGLSPGLLLGRASRSLEFQGYMSVSSFAYVKTDGRCIFSITEVKGESVCVSACL